MWISNNFKAIRAAKNAYFHGEVKIFTPLTLKTLPGSKTIKQTKHTGICIEFIKDKTQPDTRETRVLIKMVFDLWNMFIWLQVKHMVPHQHWNWGISKSSAQLWARSSSHATSAEERKDRTNSLAETSEMHLYPKTLKAYLHLRPTTLWP